MILAKVLGPVVATEKNASLNARTIYIVQPVTKDQKPTGKSMLALDSVSARPGDLVLVMREGSGCREILKDDMAPVNALITGIVDEI